MEFSPRAKALVHAILEHPRVSGNNWNAEIWGELYLVAEEALAAERCESDSEGAPVCIKSADVLCLCLKCEADDAWGAV